MDISLEFTGEVYYNEIKYIDTDVRPNEVINYINSEIQSTGYVNLCVFIDDIDEDGESGTFETHVLHLTKQTGNLIKIIQGVSNEGFETFRVKERTINKLLIPDNAMFDLMTYEAVLQNRKDDDISTKLTEYHSVYQLPICSNLSRLIIESDRPIKLSDLTDDLLVEESEETEKRILEWI